jgi:hydrogenase/urease accessory protein HupE
MDFSTYALAAFVLIGLVNGIQFAVNKEWKSFVFFLTAVIAGTVFGTLKWFGLPSTEIGLAVGISSSGVYKISQKLGGTQ